MTEGELTKMWEWVDEQRNQADFDENSSLATALEHTEDLIIEYRKMRNRFAKYVGAVCEAADALIRSGPEASAVVSELLSRVEKTVEGKR